MRRTSVRLAGGALALVALLIVSAVGFAQQGGPDGPPPGGPHGRRGPGGFGGPGGPIGLFGPFGRELNLSDEQRAKVKEIVDSFHESTKGLHEQIRPRGGPFDALKEGAFDEAAVRAAAEARAKVQVELDVAHARMMSQVYNVLTAEQKARLAELRQQFQERGPRRGPHGPRPEGAPEGN